MYLKLINYACYKSVKMFIFPLQHLTILCKKILHKVFMESLPDSIQNAWLIQKHIKTDKKLKKSLKIPKGQPESVYRRKSDNTMVKRTCKLKFNIVSTMFIILCKHPRRYTGPVVSVSTLTCFIRYTMFLQLKFPVRK
jgi:hypothetical protein